MRITFLFPHIGITGGAKIIFGYAERLAEKGHKVKVICTQPTLGKTKIKGIPFIYPRRPIMNIVKYRPAWLKTSFNIKYVHSYQEKYIPDGDIIVATAWQTASFVKNYSERKGEKFYLVQGYESEIFGDKEKVDKTYTSPLKKIVVSSWLKRLLKKKFNEDCELIVNPIDTDVFYPISGSRNNKNKRICMLHHTSKWKGITDGIKAFEIAKNKYPTIQLVMFGAQKKVIDDKYEYYYNPSSDKLREIYNSCDIFLSPSWQEGFGLTSAEAMACKCALVTTDNGGCRDYAIHNKTALVSPPKNPERLAENLMRLLGNEDLLKKIAQNGYEHVKQFTWDKAVNKMEKLFWGEVQSQK